MRYIAVLVLTLGGTLPSRSYSSFAVKVGRNPDDPSNILHDCLDLKEKDFTATIWSATFPDSLRSLTVQNCENLILNISTGEGTKRGFQFLTVRNVKNCMIIGSGKRNVFSNTSLPSRTTFTNVKNMTMNAPLYGETQFIEGILQFTNVTITSLKRKAIALVSSSLKKFSVTGSTVMAAEKEAITFDGSTDSLLEIKDSFFYSVSGNFIACNVTNAVIQKNHFVNAREGSFTLKAMNFNSSGNNAFEVEDCAFKLFAEEVQMGRSNCRCSENDSLNGKICIASSAEYMEKLSFNSNSIEFDDISHESVLKTDLTDKEKPGVNVDGKGGKVSTILARLGNRFFLLWFFAVFLLILIFPIAYAVKIFLGRFIDYALPLDVKHKPLVNMDDI